MIEPLSKMRVLKYGTLSKKRGVRMKKLPSFDDWTRIISYLLVATVVIYLSVIAYQYIQIKKNISRAKNTQYCVLDLDDSKVFLEDVTDEEMAKIFEQDDPNKSVI